MAKLGEFIERNSIEIVQFNAVEKSDLLLLPDICDEAHRRGARVVYCLHFIPGYPGLSYGSAAETIYALTHDGSVADKLKKWAISSTRPLSTNIIYKLIRKDYRRTFQAVDHVVVFTPEYVNLYSQIVGTSDKSKLSAIANPLSFSETFDPKHLYEKQHEIIAVGRLYEPQKRLSVALRAWQYIERDPNLADWHFTIVGEGASEGFYRHLIQKLGLKRVSLVGRQDPRPYYRRAAVLITTSAYEGWPMILMEAMPMGCCCVVQDTYDAARIIVSDDYNGVLVPDGNIKRLALRITEVMKNPVKRNVLATNAIESSQRFTIDKIAAQYHKLFEQLLNS